MAHDVSDLLGRHRVSTALATVLAPWARIIEYRAGDTILREGGEADRLILVIEGRVSLELHVPGQAPVLLETLGADDILGLSWMHPPYRWQLDAIALTPVLVVSIDAAPLRQKMDADPAFGHALTRAMLLEVYERLGRSRLSRADVYRAESTG